MPLVRYELRSELRLANPQLFRTASKDDSEAVLEGVAMAALVGIVRQLGDLAEFASEIFNDLHDEVMSIMGCCQELRARVSKLETELPFAEKSLLSEATHVRLIYSPGADWHASLPSDNNHCTRSDLPNFLRKLYDNCRGPPRLFLLDKFDAEGDGACVKRYTDPSIFMKLWAESELKKAEQEQQKARAERKEAKLQEKVESVTGLQTKPRERISVIHLGNLEGFSGSFIPTVKANITLIQGLDQTLESQENGDETPLQPTTSSTSLEEAQSPSSIPLTIHSMDEEAEDLEDSFARLNISQENGDQMCLQHMTGSRFAEEAPSSVPIAFDYMDMEGSRFAEEAPTPSSLPIVIDHMDMEVENAEGNFASSTMLQEIDDQMPVRLTTSSRSAEEAQAPAWAPVAINSVDTESQNSEDDFERSSQVNDSDAKSEEEEEEDGDSDSASFADALTTMDSEGESDTESRAWPDPDVLQLPKIGLEEASLLNHSVLHAHVESQRQLLPRGIDLLDEQEALPDQRLEPKHDLNVESSFLEHENYVYGVESSNPCMPLGVFAEVGHDLHDSLSPEVLVVAEDVETDYQMLSKLEAESPSEAGLSQEVKETVLVAFVNLPTLKKHIESQRQSLPEDMHLAEEQASSPQLSREPCDDFVFEPSALKQDEHTESQRQSLPEDMYLAEEQASSTQLSREPLNNDFVFETSAVKQDEHTESQRQSLPEDMYLAEEQAIIPQLSREPHDDFVFEPSALKQDENTEPQRQSLPEDIHLAEEQASSPQLSREPHDDFVSEPSDLKQDEHPCSKMESTEPPMCIKQLDTEGEMDCSLVVSEIVSDKREFDDCCRSSVLDCEYQAWPSPEAHHQTRESDQASLENCSAWEKHVDSQIHRPLQAMELLEQTFPQWGIQSQQELRPELSSPQQEIPPPVVELTAPPMLLGNLGEGEGNNNDGMISKEVINNEGKQNVIGFLVLDSGIPFQSGPDIHEVALQGKESLLNDSALTKHVESRRQRRRWDINWVEEQAQLHQLAVEPEDESVMESPEQQISSAVNITEPQLSVEYQGKVNRNGHAQLTSNTVGDKTEAESRHHGHPDVLEASVRAGAHIRSRAAPKKPVESRRQRPSKSMHLEQAIYQTKLKHEDQQHSVLMLTKPPTFLEYLGTERGNGDMPITCDLVCGVAKLDDKGAQKPGSKSQAHKFTEVDDMSPPPLTHSASKQHAESRRQRPRWDINHVKKQLVLNEMRLEDDLVPGLSVLNAEEPDSLVEASEPLMPPDELQNSPLINGHTQVVSRNWIMDDQEANFDSPEVSEPPMCPEEVEVANSPVLNDHAQVPSEPMVDKEETAHVSLEGSKPQRVSRDQKLDHDQELDCDSPDIKELILSRGPGGAVDDVAVDVDQGEEKLLHEHHKRIEQEVKNTFLPSLSSSPYTDLSSQNSDEDPEGLDDSLLSSSSPQQFTPFSLRHSPAESPARYSHRWSPVRNNWKFCSEQQDSPRSSAYIPVLPSSSPMTLMQQLPIHHDSIGDWPIQSWSIWSRQGHLSPPTSPMRQLQSSPRVSSSTYSNQMSDAETEEARTDASSQQHDILKEMSVSDTSQVQDNQNVLMELNRKQYHRWRHSGQQNRRGSSSVTGNDFNVVAIMEKANAIRQNIVGGSDEEEEAKEDGRNDDTSSPPLLNLLSTLDSKNLATSRLSDRTGL